MKRAAVFLLPLAFASCADQGPTAPSAVAPAGPSLAAKVRSADGEFTFTTIEVPGAATTIAWGINARGDVVGEYFDAAGRHGFLLRNGDFTRIDFPGALGTSARGINPGGDIVGVYRNPVEPSAAPAHGFLLTRHGEFVRVDYPEAMNTIPQRILPDGTILGCRHDNDTMRSMWGVVIARSGHSGIDDRFASMHNGATPDLRRIVGLWTNERNPEDMKDDRGEGYIIDDGEFTSFVVPGSSFTAAWDVNPEGVVVGVFRDGTTGRARGFVRLEDEDEYISLDFPGAAATQAFGINARGDVVGSYTQAGKTFGFLARKNR